MERKYKQSFFKFKYLFKYFSLDVTNMLKISVIK